MSDWRTFQKSPSISRQPTARDSFCSIVSSGTEGDVSNMQSRPHRSLRPLGLVIKENGTHICISYKETEDASTGCNIFELCFSISEPPFNVKVAFCIRDTGAAVKGVSPSKASKDKLRSAVAPDRGADKGNISLACRRPSSAFGKDALAHSPALLCSFPPKSAENEMHRECMGQNGLRSP